MTRNSLKAEYQKWLWLLVIADLAVILTFLIPGMANPASLAELVNWRLVTTIAIPVGILLIVNILPHKIKCMLVYWRHYGWLPGCEVFSKYAPDDPRIDMKALKKNVGRLPSTPNEQNSRWYQLYKMVESEPEIIDAHRNFLMYRDMAALSLPFILLAPVSLYFAGASPAAQWIGAIVFAIQFVLTALSARWSGIRFVCNVVAVHSARKVS